MIGELEVTVRFKIAVEDLETFDAYDLAQAARHLKMYYDAGEADIVEALDANPNAIISVKAIENGV